MFKQFLISNYLLLTVCICEDATEIVGRREYDSGTNSVMGFSLPMEPNGLRNAHLAKVKTAEDIVNLFETLPWVSVAVVVLAQPLAEIPALRICSFASDNRFIMEDVKARKKTIAVVLEAEGIIKFIMLSYSADGDARELKMERHDLRKYDRQKVLNLTPQNPKNFIIIFDFESIYKSFIIFLKLHIK